jgi:glucans biosynthesis protein
MGYAGFRVRYPLNRSEVFDEVIVFLGASYFRAVGRGQSYGLSARGLAINTGLATPEEFPRFREFWLGKPEPGDETLTFYALLDSESVTGAYKFVLRPGAETELDVTATLFMRKPVERLGLAPFSSMFFFGENTLDKPPDFRPEVHDSDGVTILAQDGTALWRPLINPSGVRTSIFAPPTPAGGGHPARPRLRALPGHRGRLPPASQRVGDADGHARRQRHAL